MNNKNIEEQIEHIRKEHSSAGIGYHLDLIKDLVQAEKEQYLEQYIDFIVADANRIHKEAQNKYPKGSGTTGTFWLGSNDLKRYTRKLFEQFKKESV